MKEHTCSRTSCSTDVCATAHFSPFSLVNENQPTKKLKQLAFTFQHSFIMVENSELDTDALLGTLFYAFYYESTYHLLYVYDSDINEYAIKLSAALHCTVEMQSTCMAAQ